MEDLAVVGLGCRFPAGANSPEEFWRLLRKGYDAITDVPPDRWDANFWHDAKGTKLAGKMLSKKGGFLTQKLDFFDNKFFGMSPREARSCDPQQRLLMEVGWEALEDAGLVQEQVVPLRCGVWIGASSTDYPQLQFNDTMTIDTHTQTGTATSIISNRLSFMFNFQGPSLTIDTACSSSLVAMHFACGSLWNHECDMACVGGVNVLLRPEISVGFSKLGVLSPDGHCKPFDSRANGYSRCEGAGIALIRPLSAALANNDHIYATIKSTWCNSGGHRAPGITFPSHEAQEELLYEALKRARMIPAQMQYAEAHGTGTDAGDPAESLALGTVFRAGRPPNKPLYMGSVKGNIGHMEPGAGIASFIKVCMGMEYREMAANINFRTLNPKIKADELRIRVCDHHMPWPNVSSRTEPLYAIVNSFGFGGTNATVIVSRDPAVVGPALHERFDASAMSSTPDPIGSSHLVLISARSPGALKGNAVALAEALLTPGYTPALADLSYTLSARRSHHAYRLGFVAPTVGGAAATLQALAQQISPATGLPTGDSVVGTSSGAINTEHPPRVAFIFSGQGPQWWAMGRTLYSGPQAHPVFKEAFDRVDALFTGLAGWSLRSSLLEVPSEKDSIVDKTRHAQPALFALQVALYEMFRSWGITPVAVAGHSVGEVAAAYAAGLLTLPDAVTVVYHRARLQDAAAAEGRPRGRMLAVALPPEEIEALIDAHPDAILALAAVNSPTMCTLAGDRDAIDAIEKELRDRQVLARPIKIEAAFHSPHMDFLREDLVASLAGVAAQPPAGGVAMVSSVDPDLAAIPCDGEYWWRNVRQCVQFAGAVRALVTRHQVNTLVELSPHPVLSANMSETLRSMGLGAPTHVVVPTLVRPASTQTPASPAAWRTAPSALAQCTPKYLGDDRTAVLRALTALHCRGVPVDWRHFWEQPQDGSSDGTPARRTPRLVPLPTYQWDRERCWNEPVHSMEWRRTGRPHPFLRTRVDSAAPQWVSQHCTTQLPWVSDHRLQNNIVVPGVTYVETLLAAGSQIYEGKPFQLTDVHFLKAFYMEDDEVHTVQVQLQPLLDLPGADKKGAHAHTKTSSAASADVDPSKRAYAARIFSRVEPYGPWKLHATGTLSPDEDDCPTPVDLSRLQEAACNPVDVTKFYKELFEDGLELHDRFKRATKLWIDDTASFSLSRIEPHPAVPAEDLASYTYLHPTCLDSCIQSGLILRTRRGTFFPTKISRVRFYKRLPGARCWAVSHLTSRAGATAASASANGASPSVIDSMPGLHGSSTLAGSSTTLVSSDGSIVGRLEGIQLMFLNKKGKYIASRMEALGTKTAAHGSRDHVRPDHSDVSAFEQTWLYTDDLPVPQPATCDVPSITALARGLAASMSPRLPELVPQHAHLVALQVRHALRTPPLSWAPAPGTRVSFETLCTQLGVSEGHRKYFARILSFLVDDGYLEVASGAPTSTPSADLAYTVMPKFVEDPDEPAALAERLLREYPECRPSLTLVGAIGSQLGGIVRDQVDPIHILFGEGGAISEALYRDDAELRPFNEAVAALFARLVRHWPAGRPLRILEVGAGTGGLTAFLLPLLPAYECTYTFTDVGRMFLGQAKDKFARYGSMMQFGVLDIELDPTEQGFEPHSYDLVLASNVLHATADLTASVRNCKSLLAPGGALLCMEVIRPARRWVDLTFGTTKGWWRFTDSALRPDHALLAIPQWADLMHAVGFKEMANVLGMGAGQGVYIGEVAHAAPTDAPAFALPAALPAALKQPAGSCVVLSNSSFDTHVPAVFVRTLLAAGQHVHIVLAPSAAAPDVSALSSPAALLTQVYGEAAVTALPAGWEARTKVTQLAAADAGDKVEVALTGVLASVRDGMPAPLWGVVDLWALDAPLLRDTERAAAVRAAFDTALFGLLHTAHAIGALKLPQPPRLWTLTAGANQASAEDAIAWARQHGRPAGGRCECARCSGNYGVNAVQRTLWGMSRVLNNERPQWRASCLDLSLCPTPIEAYSAAIALLADHPADEMALRGVRRLVPRLHRQSLESLSTDGVHVMPLTPAPASGDAATTLVHPVLSELAVPETPFALSLAGPSRIFFQECAVPGTSARPVGSTQVAVHVGAAGVAFRDVLLAAGALPLGAASPFTSYFGPHVGMEFAGIVTAVGTEVTHVRPGDFVMGLARESVASHVLTEGAFVTALPKPSAATPNAPRVLAVDQAAALPMQYVTAYVALLTYGRLQRGETVLIHAAAGGVGMCAIHLARLVGATVIATAGSPGKRDFLTHLGIAHVLDSRTPAFGREVLALTGGRGVDVVLNSLAGDDMLAAGFACVKPGGRFVEIGKADIYGGTRLPLTPFARNIAYFSVSIDRLMYIAPETIHDALTTCARHLAAGELPPLPVRTYPVTAAADAFRFVMHARHIGKVVLMMPSSSTPVLRVPVPPTEPLPAPAVVQPPTVIPLPAQGLGKPAYPLQPVMQSPEAFMAAIGKELDTITGSLAPAAPVPSSTPPSRTPTPLPTTTSATPTPAPAPSAAPVPATEAPTTPAPEYHITRHDATYIVTGGTSGFGLAVAQHLLEWGARHIVLLSRSGGAHNEGDRAAIEALVARAARLAEADRAPANVWVRQCDVGDEDSLDTVLREVRSALPPIRGIIHCAMSLRDKLLDQLTPDDFLHVLHAKAVGGWNLHRLTLAAHDPIEMFVLFSSLNVILGNQGQCNYACANMFLDALAVHRRSLGLAANSVNWGVLAETGYVARHDNIRKMLASHGVNYFTPGWACDLIAILLGGATASLSQLVHPIAIPRRRDIDEDVDDDTFEEGSEELPTTAAEGARATASATPTNTNSAPRLASTPVNVGIFELDFPKYFSFAPTARTMQRFLGFAAQVDAMNKKAAAASAAAAGAAAAGAADGAAGDEAGPSADQLTLSGRLQAAPSLPDAAAVLEKALAAQSAIVLGLHEVDVAQPLTSLGFDSMMAIELKNWVDRQLHLDVPVVDFVRGPSCRKLALQLLDRMGLAATLAKTAAAPAPSTASSAGPAEAAASPALPLKEQRSTPEPPAEAPAADATAAATPATAAVPDEAASEKQAATPIAFLFTGQGSAGVNMGMDLYQTSPAARAVWDEAERHFVSKFGISLLNIVRTNPASLTVSFEGPEGARLRANYMGLTMNPPPEAGAPAPADDADALPVRSALELCEAIVPYGPLKTPLSTYGSQERKARNAPSTLPPELIYCACEDTAAAAAGPDRIFPTITADTPSYTFSSPKGLLYATHFTQPCTTVFEKAAYEHLVQECGLDEETIRKRTVIAGHSLGEYCALLCGAKLASVAQIAELTFVRGLAMQGAVTRDADGISPYAMMAVSPKRAANLFQVPDPDGLLARLCAAVRKASGDRLIEVVNYNVRGDQLVVAGERYTLWVLGDVIETLNQRSKAAGTAEAVLSSVDDVCRDSVAAHAYAETPQSIPRAGATMQLPSIDVPFHSSLLRSTTARFRRFLARFLPPARTPICPDGLDYAGALAGRYIPNVTGRIFEVTPACCAALRDVTCSPMLARLLQPRAFEQRLAAQGPAALARTMLQEALATQLALPVQWVQAQDTLLQTLRVHRIIEIGPSTPLQGMLKKTLAMKPQLRCELLSWSTDQEAILARGPHLLD